MNEKTLPVPEISATKDGVTTRQLCFILAIFFPVNKLILLPAIYANHAGGDILVSALFNLILEGLSAFAVLFLIRERQNETLFALVERKTSTLVARILSGALGAYYLFSCLLPVLEHKAYIQNVMYDTLPSLLVFLPFFLFSAYAATKGLKCVGRAADAGMPLFLCSFPLLLAMAVASADFTALLPPLYDISAAFTGFYRAFPWCANGAWLLPFVGRVRVEKDEKFLTKTGLSYLAGAVGAILFFAVFYGIFSTVAQNEPFAVSKIARYYGALKTLGRIDYLFIYVLLVVQLFALVLPVCLAAKSFQTAFDADTPLFSSIGVNGALFLFVLFLSRKLPVVEEAIGQYAFAVFVLFGYLLPLLCPLLAKKNKEKKV